MSVSELTHVVVEFSDFTPSLECSCGEDIIGTDHDDMMRKHREHAAQASPESGDMPAPYYADDLVTLYHGKFEEILPALGVTADLLIADPPYGETTLEWDRWPVGWPSIAASFGRSMWCFGSMRMFLDRRGEFGHWNLSQDIVWEKHNGSGLNADRFKRVHEHALHWYRGPWSEIHHETPTTPDATARTVRRKAKPVHHQGARGASSYTSEDGGPRLMRSVMFHRSMHGRAINETEKPVPLIAPLIEYGSPAGGLVVDLFSGSSAALVAARMLGRRSIGFEVRESQCEAAANRLSQQELVLIGADPEICTPSGNAAGGDPS